MFLPETQNPLSTDPIDEPGGNEWILTYADLMTLLLVFFVLLFSISSLNTERFKLAVTSIQTSLGQSLPPAVDGEQMGGSGIMDHPVRPGRPDVLDQIQQIIANHRMADHIEAYALEGKVFIQVSGAVLFDSGRADLNPAGIPVLDEIADIIKRFPDYNVNIKGHTDNVPIQTPYFASNWDLSAIRATTVLKHLIQRGIAPQRLTATGYGDCMPIADNGSEAGRARNRRVEFVLEKESR